jgi:hypothetical protein
LRDNIKYESRQAHPLQEVLDNDKARKRSHRLRWTDGLVVAFKTLKAAICDSHKLYLIVEEATIFLQTDDLNDKHENILVSFVVRDGVRIDIRFFH